MKALAAWSLSLAACGLKLAACRLNLFTKNSNACSLMLAACRLRLVAWRLQLRCLLLEACGLDHVNVWRWGLNPLWPNSSGQKTPNIFSVYRRPRLERTCPNTPYSLSIYYPAQLLDMSCFQLLRWRYKARKSADCHRL